jgi:hypothetical protein
LYALVVAVSLAFATPPSHSFAEDRGKPARASSKKKPKKAKKRVKKPREARRGEKPGRPDKPREKEAARPSSEASRAATDAARGVDSEIVKEGETNVKVMRFSGLDVEGRLKSPQLLYFVNRVRAEFDRPKLPHRSFMPELERSTNQDPL